MCIISASRIVLQFIKSKFGNVLRLTYSTGIAKWTLPHAHTHCAICQLVVSSCSSAPPEQWQYYGAHTFNFVCCAVFNFNSINNGKTNDGLALMEWVREWEMVAWALWRTHMRLPFTLLNLWWLIKSGWNNLREFNLLYFNFKFLFVVLFLCIAILIL